MDGTTSFSADENHKEIEKSQEAEEPLEHTDSYLISNPPTDQQEISSALIFNSAEIADSLSKSVTEALNRTMEHKSSLISALVRNQDITLESLEHANTKFKDQADMLARLTTITEKTRLYKDKVMIIKKRMDNIKIKSQHLKKTAARLHTQKQKLMIDKEEMRRQEMEKERLLTAQELTVTEINPSEQIEKL